LSKIHGNKGRLYLGIASSTAAAEPMANLTQWSLDFATDKVDVTACGDANKNSVSGLPDCNGTYAGVYDTVTAQTYTAATDGAARRFYLYPDATNSAQYWWGTAVFDFTAQGGVTDAVTIDGSFAAASAVTKIG
jgi:hypothetical protein